MIENASMLPGEFGAAARLSPKALRLYAEQGLLVPARVDPVNGYRHYRPDQIPRARLISRLRTLGLPLARVATLLDVPADVRQVELLAWLTAQEDDLRRRRSLVLALAEPAPARFGDVGLRAVPKRRLLCARRRLHVGGLGAFVAAAEAGIRAHLRASGAAADGGTQVRFHGLVTHDSDGPVEVTVAFTGRVEPVGDLSVRLEAAHTEAYLPVDAADAEFPAILRVYDALESWIDHDGRMCLDSPRELTPGTGDALFDVSYPVSLAKEH